MAGAGGQGQFHPPLPTSWRHPTPRYSRLTDGQSSPGPGKSQEPGSGRRCREGGAKAAGPRHTRHARGGTEGQTAPEVGAGRAYRGAEVRRVSGRRRAGTTSRGERGVRALAPREPGRPAAPLVPGRWWVCPWVSGFPRLRAVPRHSPPAVQLSALPRAAPSAPPERQHRRPRAWAQSAGPRGPMALAARARAPRPRRRRLSAAAPHCSLAVTRCRPPP